jgi:hypothetical protein
MGQFIFGRTLYAIATLAILSLTVFTVVRLTGDAVIARQDGSNATAGRARLVVITIGARS